ncbi:MAG: tetratricopeptide repeat protein [Candidatus Krumholzibacteriia bacterium]
MTAARKRIAIGTAAAVVIATVAIGYKTTSRKSPGVATPATGKSVRDLLRLSDAYIHRGEDRSDLYAAEAAESLAYAALEIDSLDVDVLNQLAKAKYALKKFEEVLLLENYVLKLHPENPTAWGIQGDAYQVTGGYRGADSSYHVMYAFDQGFHSLLRIAREEFLLRDYDKSIQFIDEAIEKAQEEEVGAHDLASAYADLAKILLARGYLEPALHNIDYALALQPGSAVALSVKVRLLRAQHKYGEAIGLCRRLVELSEHPRHKSALARLYRDVHRQAVTDSLVQIAAAEFEALSRDFPERVRRDQVTFYLEWDIERERALRLARRESRERRDSSSYSLLAWAYHKNGDSHLAWSSIALALRRGVKDPELLYRAAVIAKAAGKMDRYRTFSERVREVVPNVEQVYGPLEP